MQNEISCVEKQLTLDEGRLLKGLNDVVATYPQYVVERGINRYWKQYVFLLKKLVPYLERLPENAYVCDIGAGPAIVPLVMAHLGYNVSLIDRWSEYAPQFDNQMGTTGEFFSVSTIWCEVLRV